MRMVVSSRPRSSSRFSSVTSVRHEEVSVVRHTGSQALRTLWIAYEAPDDVEMDLTLVLAHWKRRQSRRSTVCWIVLASTLLSLDVTAE